MHWLESRRHRQLHNGTDDTRTFRLPRGAIYIFRNQEMKIALVGSRYFGASVLQALQNEDAIEVHGPAFFGLYQEARRRGYTSNTLDNYFEYPANIHNRDTINWIAQELHKFGAEVKLRAKPQ